MSVTVAVCGVSVPSKVTDLGEIEQVELAGAPLQVKLITPLKSPKGVTVTVDTPADPGLTVIDVGDIEGVK